MEWTAAVIPRECKRLAEVDFPIAVVSKHALREKSSPRGHPSTLHLWWARRPLGSCRAILLALLLPDPCDRLCPDDFKSKARKILRPMPVWVGSTDEDLRAALLRFVGDFADWDHAANSAFLEVGRSLVKAAHPEETPLVADPFAGGGSIPLEALRLGCDAFASDLNPVACLILKTMLEDFPRHGSGLADELRRVGAEIKTAAEKGLADFYPADPDGARPIAYLWARTVHCEAPNCGAEIPLMRSFWLSKKADRQRALRYRVTRTDGATAHAVFEVFEPKSDDEVPRGTVSRARATCLCCSSVLAPDRVRSQLRIQRGGADVIFDDAGNRIGGALLLAVVTVRAGIRGRHYRLATRRDYDVLFKSHQRLAAILGKWERGEMRGLCPIPDEPAPTKDTHRAVGSQIPLYGITTLGDLFTRRQKLTLATLVSQMLQYSTDCVGPLLAFALNRVAMSDMTCTRWNAVAEKMQHTFGRQALPMVWDFAEIVATANAPGNWRSGYELVADVIDASRNGGSGQVYLSDATDHRLPDQGAAVWFTDPPYYDAVPYADLSDFFFVWLKRALPGHALLYDPFNSTNTLTPKAREALQCERVTDSEGRPKDRSFYEQKMACAFAEGRRVLQENGIASVVFAHKTTEGWEALLSGMIRGGWTITGSWPIATEMGSRLNARETASLATSVHFVCRPRPEDAPISDWAEVLQELPKRVSDWMARLEREGVRGADLVFACIGPALEIFSRYSRVETAEGDEVPLAQYLGKVWEVVGRTALAQVLGNAEAQASDGSAGALEEDARLTALFL